METITVFHSRSDIIVQKETFWKNLEFEIDIVQNVVIIGDCP